MVCAKYQGKQLGIITYHSESKKGPSKLAYHTIYELFIYRFHGQNEICIPKININIVGQK